MASVVRMPSVLAGATEAAIAAWLVAPGDSVSVGDPLAEIETEKAVVEYGAEEAGVVGRIVLAAGDSGEIGVPIVVLVKDGETDADIDAALGGEVVAAAPARGRLCEAGPAAPGGHRAYESQPVQGAIPATRIFASPIVRKIAREQGIDLTALAGTGPNGRIVRRDLERLAARPVPAPAQPAPAQAAAGGTLIPHTPIRRAIARRLTQSKATTPHFYLTTECVVDELPGCASGSTTAPVKISVNDFVIMAVAAAFRRAGGQRHLSDEGLVAHAPSTSIAVATDGGLSPPCCAALRPRFVIAAEAQSRAAPATGG
jgi:pyruvate dehydrogenase E2 component (dihydrolipoamide acetyltransferase)